MFDLDKFNTKNDLCPDDLYRSRSYSEPKKEIFIKEKVVIKKNENNVNFEFIVDTLELFKKMDNYQADMIRYEKDIDKLTIFFKYRENIKNTQFVEAFQSFIDKYKNTFRNGLVLNI